VLVSARIGFDLRPLLLLLLLLLRLLLRELR
jgi:hypothetical protein